MEPTLYDLCQNYIAAINHYENQPEDPFGEAAVEYAEEQLSDWFHDKQVDKKHEALQQQFLEGFGEGRVE